MKKLLSIILAAAMLLSLVPSVFAVEGEGTGYTYNFNSKDTSFDYSSTLSTSTLLKKVTNEEDGNVTVEKDDAYSAYDDTTGRHWKMFDTVDEVKTKFKDATTNLYRVAGFDANGLRVNFPGYKQWFALKIRVPEPGIYKVSTVLNQATSSRMGTGFMSLYPGNTLESEITYGEKGTGGNQVLNSCRVLSSSVPYKGSDSNCLMEFAKVLCANTANEEFIYVFGSLANTSGTVVIKNFTLTKISDEITFDNEKIELQVGEDQTLSVSLASQKLHGASNVVFSTSDDEGIVSAPTSASPDKNGVATIKVVADKAGETTLTARIGDATASIPVKVTAPAPAESPEYVSAFTPSDTVESSTPANADVIPLAYATGGGTIAPANIEAEDNENGTYTVKTDAEVNGYTFRYWARGLQSKDRKRIVSFANEFTYTPSNEKNYLIAVYDKAGTIPATTEYYNANGQRIDWKEGDPMPYMAGYGEASGWKEPVYGIKEAIYGEPIKYNITIGDAEPVKYAWGDPVPCVAEDKEGYVFWGWKKTVNNVDAGIVSADKNYTFYAWEDCTVTPVYKEVAPVFEGEKKRIILGTFMLGGKTAVMAEFFGFDNALERGITIDGTDYAMTNKNADQFTIVDDDNKGNISGYAILANGVKYIYNLNK